MQCRSATAACEDLKISSLDANMRLETTEKKYAVQSDDLDSLEAILVRDAVVAEAKISEIKIALESALYELNSEREAKSAFMCQRRSLDN